MVLASAPACGRMPLLRGAMGGMAALRRPLLLLPRARLLHSSRPTRGTPTPTPAGRPPAVGIAGGHLPAWVPCAGSVGMVLRGAARGFRSTAARRAAGTAAPSEAAPKLILGRPPRFWAMGAGHCAFVMLASMYLMTDMVLLRVLGITANGFDMFYCFLVAEAPLWLNIRWGAFYVLVNLVQLGQLYWETRELAMDPAQLEAYESLFKRHGFTQPQFLKLFRLGTPRLFAAGEEVVREGDEAKTLVLILDGQGEVRVSGNPVAMLHGGVVGAAEYMHGSPSEEAEGTSGPEANSKTRLLHDDSHRREHSNGSVCHHTVTSVTTQ